MDGQPRVIYGRGDQTLRFVPVDRHGRPSRVTSATYVIVDVGESEESGDRSIASGNAAISAVDTTTTAACGQGAADAKLIPVTSAVGITEGRSYLLSQTGRRYLVTVAEVAGSNVYAHQAIPAAFASGALFRACELEATFPSAVANDQERIQDGDRFQVVWSYTLEGDAVITAQRVDFRRYEGEAWITEADMFRGYPLLADRMRNRISPGDAITVATEDLRVEFKSSGVDPSQFRTDETGLVAIRFRAIAYALRWLGGPDDQALAIEYDNRWERLSKGLVQGAAKGMIRLSQQQDEAVTPRVDGFFDKP